MCDWGYCKHNGPDKWATKYPIAGGKRQSPIDIKSKNCCDDAVLSSKPITMNYDPKMTTITNTGAGWKVTAGGNSTIEGGPLPGAKFKLEQFHCHWGKTSSEGSEHFIDGVQYPAEIHLVHWNCEKYSSFGEAVDKEDGLAVIGVFFELGDEHPEMAKLVELLPKIIHSGDTTTVEQNIDCNGFLPKNKSYWTYPGSLTTPPCLETVTWIVMKDPVQISEEQLDAFRELLSYGREEKRPVDEFEGKILTNFRPPLETGSRTVRACSFK